jgi:hypothetical protein
LPHNHVDASELLPGRQVDRRGVGSTRRAGKKRGNEALDVFHVAAELPGRACFHEVSAGRHIIEAEFSEIVTRNTIAQLHQLSPSGGVFIAKERDLLSRNRVAVFIRETARNGAVRGHFDGETGLAIPRG